MEQLKLSPLIDETGDDQEPEQGIGICLSGGGYRAMLFHLGVLWRLAELGYLSSSQREGMHAPLGSLQRISSVSGGSITAGVLALAWNNLKVDDPDLAARFQTLVANPVQKFSGTTTISIASGLWAALVSSINKKIVKTYQKELFGNKTLQDLPDQPRFVINATNLQSGKLWRFSKPYTADWRVGMIEQPGELLAKAVAASSAFPPFLSPARFNYGDDEYSANSGQGLQRAPFTTQPTLSDGGVYDNLGLETVYKRYKTVIVSDAGGSFEAQAKVHGDWARQSYRVLNALDHQVRCLRKRILLSALVKKERFGAFWSIRSDIKDYPATDTLPCPHDKTLELANISTDLAAKDLATQRRLINWGYAICDAGIRSWVENNLPAPDNFPFAEERV